MMLWHCRNTRSLAPLWRKLVTANQSISLSINAAPVTQERSVKKFELVEQRGRPWLLLSQPSEVSLAVCVSADLNMSMGVARDFKRKYGGEKDLKKQFKKVGQVAIQNRNDTSFVYYLITRRNWWDSATLNSMRSSLEILRNHCLENGVKNLAIPRLGTGYDRLEWPFVKDIFEQVFSDCDISVTAYTTR